MRRTSVLVRASAALALTCAVPLAAAAPAQADSAFSITTVTDPLRQGEPIVVTGVTDSDQVTVSVTIGSTDAPPTHPLTCEVTGTTFRCDDVVPIDFPVGDNVVEGYQDPFFFEGTPPPSSFAAFFAPILPARSTAPVLNPPAPAGPTDPVVVAGTAQPGRTITIRVDGTPRACTPATTSASGQFSCTLAERPSPGPHTITATAVDPTDPDPPTAVSPASTPVTLQVAAPPTTPAPSTPSGLPVSTGLPPGSTVRSLDQPPATTTTPDTTTVTPLPLAPAPAPETDAETETPEAGGTPNITSTSPAPVLPAADPLALLSFGIAAGILARLAGARGLAVTGQRVAAVAVLTDRDDSDPTRHVVTRDATGPGDRSLTWRFPGHRFSDRLGRLLPPRVARRSPLLARLIEDGSDLRAMVGVLSLLLPIAGGVLGAVAAANTGGLPLPPSIGLLIAIAALATLDALAGAVATVVFTVAVLAGGGLTAPGGPDTKHGVVVLLGLALIWIALPLIGSAIRPFRRTGTPSTELTWHRGADLLIAALLVAWVTQKTVQSLDLFAGVPTGLPPHADLAAIVIFGAVAVRVALEQLALATYPQRLAAVDHPDDLPDAATSSVLSGMAVRTAAFGFIGYVFIGATWHLWVGIGLFALPQLTALLGERVSVPLRIRRFAPRGIVEILVLVVACTLAVRLAVDTAESTLDTLRAAFVLLAVPPAILGLLALAGPPPGERRSTWPREFIGLAILVLTTWLALRGWDY